LHRVGVERYRVPRRQLRDLRHRLDRADLVVGPHHADQGDAVAVPLQLGGERLDVHPAVPVHRQPRDARALVRPQPGDGVEHGVVLDRAGQHPVTARVRLPARPEQALHREVVALGAARSEDHLRGSGAERRRHPFPRLLHPAAGTPARVVQGGRVAHLAGRGGVGGDRLGVHGRGGGVIEIGHIHRAYRRPHPGAGRPAAAGRSRVRWPRRGPLPRLRLSSIACGATLNRSPTTPQSAISKIGASGSLLTATMTREVCIPARCWIAPEIPSAMYSCGETVLPVWPTWYWWGQKPASVAARDAPTAPPSRSASSSTSAKFSALPTPRPPETTTDASVSSGRALFGSATRSTTRASFADSGIETSTVDTVGVTGDGVGVSEFGRSVASGNPRVTLE